MPTPSILSLKNKTEWFFSNAYTLQNIVTEIRNNMNLCRTLLLARKRTEMLMNYYRWNLETISCNETKWNKYENFIR